MSLPKKIKTISVTASASPQIKWQLTSQTPWWWGKTQSLREHPCELNARKRHGVPVFRDKFLENSYTSDSLKDTQKHKQRGCPGSPERQQQLLGLPHQFIGKVKFGHPPVGLLLVGRCCEIYPCATKPPYYCRLLCGWFLFCVVYCIF